MIVSSNNKDVIKTPDASQCLLYINEFGSTDP